MSRASDPTRGLSGDDEKRGADDRARTGDLDLGKVALYQLSYVRVVYRL